MILPGGPVVSGGPVGASVVGVSVGAVVPVAAGVSVDDVSLGAGLGGRTVADAELISGAGCTMSGTSSSLSVVSVG